MARLCSVCMRWLKNRGCRSPACERHEKLTGRLINCVWTLTWHRVAIGSYTPWSHWILRRRRSARELLAEVDRNEENSTWGWSCTCIVREVIDELSENILLFFWAYDILPSSYTRKQSIMVNDYRFKDQRIRYIVLSSSSLKEKLEILGKKNY